MTKKQQKFGKKSVVPRAFRFDEKHPTTPGLEIPGVSEPTNNEENTVSYDNFEVKVADDLIKTEHIKEIGLPKFSFNGSVKNLSIDEATPIQIVMYDIENSCQKLLTLAKKGSFSFKLILKNDNDNKMRSTFLFNNASVKVIDFGSLINGPRDGQRLILCELHYKEIEIDGVKI